MRKHSIYHLIQENRKLFYSGIIKNNYKIPTPNDILEKDRSSVKLVNPEKEEKLSFKERSICILQDIFNE